MKKITLYATDTYCSVSISNGATRETSAPSFPEVITAMQDEDRKTLRTFCAGIVASIDAQERQLVKGGRS